ncbi:hypothetical protein [Falsihalocynthiibacter arcticus]|uniref:Initiator Rep protein domain-containing protein n=1 Tax=Falsihalocynthiibacter arcticus TaxID=1579316 RepID=A0A126V5A4_9RHOB|nr:hypothetical protein [Falsihalocynthiibacter arcticus]AML53056.1 hypothetical protein RC74_18940 [Falsihalocynthiibacter arcticus]
MFYKSARVQISWALYRRVIECDLSPPSFRVLIGMLLYHDYTGDWQADHIVVPEKARAFLVLSEFRHYVGLAGNKDARTFKKVVRELKQSDLFEDIQLSGDSRVIEWVLAPNVFIDQIDREFYVLLMLSEVAECSTPLEYQILCELSRIHQQRVPQFDTSYLRAIPYAENAVEWKELRRQLVRILGKWGQRKNVGFVVGLLRPTPNLRVAGIVIRAWSETTMWSTKTLYRFPPNSQIVRFYNGKAKSVKPEFVNRVVQKQTSTSRPLR